MPEMNELEDHLRNLGQPAVEPERVRELHRRVMRDLPEQTKRPNLVWISLAAAALILLGLGLRHNRSSLVEAEMNFFATASDAPAREWFQFDNRSPRVSQPTFRHYQLAEDLDAQLEVDRIRLLGRASVSMLEPKHQG
ncbi:MAG: hypothetical protein ACI9QL_004618 [Candidatus Omnitrophota bacterium]|jgi:hypothetical protein